MPPQPHTSAPRMRVIASALTAVAVLVCAPMLGAGEHQADNFSNQAAIEQRLDDARSELQQLPSGTEPGLREQFEQLAATCQYHLGAAKIAADKQRESAEAEQLAISWNGFPQPPPYSILDIDELRETRASLQAAEQAADTQIQLSSRSLEKSRNQLAEHQRAERRSEEQASTSTTQQDRLAAERSSARESLSSRIIAENLGRLKLLLEAQHSELAAIRSRIKLIDLQLKTAQGKTAFSRQLLDQILTRIARERTQAEQALVSASDGSQAMDPLLSWRIEFLDLEERFWNQRFASFDSKDPAARKEAIKTFSEQKSHVDDWAVVGDLRADNDGVTTVGELDPVQLRDARQQVLRMQRRINFAIQELGGEQDSPSLLDRALRMVRSVWEAELYLAEVDAYIDGKKVTTYRAVTPGKLAQLALILIVGWFLLKFLTRRVRGLVYRRGVVSATTADVASKWVFGTGLALLVIYGLNRVHIPFTALAFLGGALAIGVGFGTQTLLKNFISGLILILERPFRIGDLVEVDGVTGRIISIGLRASVVQHIDGIDTLIPNSSLLENKVTNWTFSHGHLRHSITIGVAYDSPTAEVADTLLEAARNHNLVLDDPEPEVRFEDFGDSALTFRLLFWLDATKTPRGPLASDLRFTINKAFAEHGIRIPYPQRDLHFDREQALPATLQPSSEATTDDPNPLP